MSDYWDYMEPTDEERLTWDIEEDAENPDSNALAYRQNQRWEEFRQEQADKFDRLMSDLERAHHPKPYPGFTWWELWQPPAAVGDKPSDLQKLGEISFSHEMRTQDVHSYNERFVRTLPVSYTTYMDFAPRVDHGLPDLRIFRKPEVKMSDMYGEWGYWDQSHQRLRSRVMGVRVKEQSDSMHPDYTGLAICVKEPPPYGVWMPALHFTDDDGKRDLFS